MKIKLLSDVYIKGKPTKAGKVVDLPEATAKELVGNKQAEFVNEPEKRNK